MSGVVIERCTDPAVIAEIHAATVSVAYRPYFPAGSPPPAAGELVPLWQTRLADPTATVLQAAVAGRPVGSVLARADATFPGRELAALHVLYEHRGRTLRADVTQQYLGVPEVRYSRPLP